MANVLVDDTVATLALLRTVPAAEVALVTDNAYMELLADLSPADGLCRLGLAALVVLQVKSQPVFDSDVMQHDVD